MDVLYTNIKLTWINNMESKVKMYEVSVRPDECSRRSESRERKWKNENGTL